MTDHRSEPTGLHRTGDLHFEMGHLRIMPFAAALVLIILWTPQQAVADNHDLNISHFTAGDVEAASAVVLLADAIGLAEKGWTDSAAAALGGAALLIPAEVFSSDGNHSEELSQAVQSLGFGSAQPPVVGFGTGADYAVQLAYQEWVRRSPS